MLNPLTGYPDRIRLHYRLQHILEDPSFQCLLDHQPEYSYPC